jgi:HAD superfamily hydrolase (TIGR01662 family)
MLEKRGAIEHPLDSQGVWCQILRRPAPGRAALFLDRDGTVVKETGYLCRVDDIVLIPGAGEVISTANQRGIAVVMVTNQSGIGRGYYSWPEFKSVQDAIVASPAHIIQMPKAISFIRITRRANPIPACCCKPPQR